MHQNINGLINKSDLLGIHLNELSEEGKPIDIICITEHNMKEGDHQHLHITNYSLATCYTRHDRNGGSCILIKNTHKFEVINVKKWAIPHLIECCAIKLSSHPIIIICMYRPPNNNKDKISSFFDNLDTMLKEICLKHNNKIVLCGDFNIDICKNSKTSVTFQNILRSYNLILGTRSPTRLRSGTCIDNIVHNIRGSRCEVKELALSDHTAQLLKCRVKKTCTLSHWFIHKRDYSDENITKFRECLQNLTFYDVFICSDPNNAFNEFHDLYKLFYDLCFPINKIKVSLIKRPKWITTGLKKCSKRKRDMLWEYRKSPNPENKNKLKTYTNRLKHIIKQTQKAQNSHFIDTSENKSKATWSIINKQKLNNPKEGISSIMIGNKVINSPEQIAESFNEYFINLIQSQNDINYNNTLTYNRTSNSIFMIPTIPADIIKIIHSLKNTNSTGYDDITTKVIKATSTIIAPILSHIINSCIEKGVFPEILKISVIKPMFKKGDRQDPSNYRPIALIPVFSKIFEKILHTSIYSFLETNKILIDEQYGFRKNKSVNAAIYALVEHVLINMDNRTPVVALFMDMSKAFDHVSHKILINKLEKCGIRGNILELVKSYLTNRQQFTCINKISPSTKTEIIYTSELRECLFGVPQGGVLAPLFFIVYINDMPKIINNPMILFADDSTILFKSQNDEIFEKEINDNLNDIITWLNENNLKINLEKTNYISFEQRTNHKKPDIRYGDKNIRETDHTKFLGIWIDKNMNWKIHIENVCKKLSQCSYALYNLRKVSNQATLLMAYHGYVSSTLRYGLMFWGNSPDREMAFKAQKKCIRAICGIQSTDSCKPYFQKLQLLTLPCLYIYEVANYVKANIHLYNHPKSIRYKNTICLTRHKKAVFTKNFLGMAPKIYNKLPKQIIDITNKDLFKKCLNEFLAAKCYYTINDYLNERY